MSKKAKGIEVWLRVKPTKKPSNELSLEVDEGKIEFKFTKDALRNLETR